MPNKARTLILKVPLYLFLLQYFCLLPWQSMRAVNQQGWVAGLLYSSQSCFTACNYNTLFYSMALLDKAIVSHSKMAERKGKVWLQQPKKQREGIKETPLEIICAHSTMQVPRLVNGAGAHFLTGVVYPGVQQAWTHRSWQQSLSTQQLFGPSLQLPMDNPTELKGNTTCSKSGQVSNTVRENYYIHSVQTGGAAALFQVLLERIMKPHQQNHCSVQSVRQVIKQAMLTIPSHSWSAIKLGEFFSKMMQFQKYIRSQIPREQNKARLYYWQTIIIFSSVHQDNKTE